jgi:DNA-binding GntR family transcriptional regulator
MSNSTIIARTAAPLRQQVVRLIREDILNGALVPGQRLVESGLCEAYGVSRTVIREALRQLESERLITVMANLGPIVTILTEAEIRALYIVRGTLEGLAGKLFALTATAQDCMALLNVRARLDKEYRNGDVDSREAIKAEFYLLLLKGAGNKVLMEELRNIHARIAIFRRFAFVNEDRVEPSIKELETIIDAAARDRNPEAAWAACEHHILIAGELAILEYAKLDKDVVAAE